jgi:hypothetical protein
MMGKIMKNKTCSKAPSKWGVFAQTVHFFYRILLPFLSEKTDENPI